MDNASTRTFNTETTTASSTADETTNTGTGTVVDLQQQTINEFLTNAERIASSSTSSSSSSTSGNSPISKGKRKAGDSAVGPTKGRRKRSTNDDSHRRDGKQKQSRRQTKQNKQQQQQHQHQRKDYDIDNDTKNQPLQHDDDSIPIVDETLVKAVIDHDEQLNREVTELFQMDPFFGDEYSSTSLGSEDGDDDENEWDCDKIKNCMSGCMFLQ
jgi:hypothetical protein